MNIIALTQTQDDLYKEMKNQLFASILSAGTNLVVPVVMFLAAVLAIFFIAKYVFDMSKDREPEVSTLVVKLVLCIAVFMGVNPIWSVICNMVVGA